MGEWRRRFLVGLCVVFAWGGLALSASDPTMTSNNYSVIESELGGNGCSGTVASGYNCGTSSHFGLNPGGDDGGSSLGESAVGASSSSNYSTNSGYDTTAQPGLALTVNQGSMNLGILSTVVTSSTTASFTVYDYTSSGYAVQIIGTPPTYSGPGGHQLTAMGNNTSPASAGSSEQFGMNLRANSSPNSVGTDPLEVPDNQAFGSSTFSYGQAGNYGQGGTTYGVDRTYSVPNKFTYNSGDIIASSAKTSGPTLFTMSFMANIVNTTPGGMYTGSLTLVATGTF